MRVSIGLVVVAAAALVACTLVAGPASAQDVDPLEGMKVKNDAGETIDARDAEPKTQEDYGKDHYLKWRIPDATCETCQALVEESTLIMIGAVGAYQAKASGKEGESDDKKFKFTIQGYSEDATRTPRMKEYGGVFRDTCENMRNRTNSDVIDIGFFLGEIFGKSFSGGGISRVNPRHQTVYKHANDLCSMKFHLCPDRDGRDGSAEGPFDECAACVSLVDDLELMLSRSYGRKVYRSRAHVWDEIGALCEASTYRHEDAVAAQVHEHCDWMVDEFEDEIGAVMLDNKGIADEARRICVGVADVCLAEEVEPYVQRLLKQRAQFPYLNPVEHSPEPYRLTPEMKAEEQRLAKEEKRAKKEKKKQEEREKAEELARVRAQQAAEMGAAQARGKTARANNPPPPEPPKGTKPYPPADELVADDDDDDDDDGAGGQNSQWHDQGEDDDDDDAAAPPRVEL